MYSTCLFCNRALGDNQVVERFPVGRRLAFDAAKGRLWVVCKVCLRWNLTPLEERWEAIEDCERRFRDTRPRVATEHIGLARAAEGLELVRVGKPLRREYAAWRYGGIFTRRRRRTHLAAGGAGTLLLAGLATQGIAPAIYVAAASIPLWYQLPAMLNALRRRLRIYGHATDKWGREHVLRGAHIAATELLPNDDDLGWRLHVRHDLGAATVERSKAVQVLGRVLETLNWEGGSQETVADAVRRIEKEGSPEQFIQARMRDRLAIHSMVRLAQVKADMPSMALSTWDPDVRLALEMSLHEETERAALEGELAALEEAWRDAEEIASIADDLVVPPWIVERLRGLRGRLRSYEL